MTILLYPNNNSSRFNSYRSLTASSSLSLADKIVVYEGATIALITLPSMNFYYKGAGFTIKNNSAFTLSITSEDGKTIDGEISQEIPPKNSISLVYISEWHIV